MPNWSGTLRWLYFTMPNVCSLLQPYWEKQIFYRTFFSVQVLQASALQILLTIYMLGKWTARIRIEIKNVEKQLLSWKEKRREIFVYTLNVDTNFVERRVLHPLHYLSQVQWNKNYNTMKTNYNYRHDVGGEYETLISTRRRVAALTRSTQFAQVIYHLLQIRKTCLAKT